MPENTDKLLRDLAEGRRHGTLIAYTVGKCRCKWCRKANAAYMGANMRRLRGNPLRLVGPTALTSRITVDLTDDDLVLWDERAKAAGLSRQAYIRRNMREAIDLELRLEQQREQELATPLVTIGG